MAAIERTRSINIGQAGQAPSTFDRETRSVSVVAATEDPVEMYDSEMGGTIGEVLPMATCKLPKSRQIPLLDTHNRYSVGDILGSARDLATDKDTLNARVVYSSVPKGEEAMTKTEEGHLSDFSIGYRVHKYARLKAGETRTIGGKEYSGPLLVATSWTPRELSTCPIGADPRSKARSDNNSQIYGGNTMPKELREKLEKLGLRKDASDEEAHTFLAGLDIRQAGQNTPPVIDDGDSTTPLDAAAVRTITEDVQRAERQRSFEIRSMCTDMDCGDLADDLVNRGLSVDDARKQVMSAIKTRMQNPGTVPAGSIEFGLDSKDKFRAAVTDAVLIRGAYQRPTNSPALAPGHESFLSYKLSELARECLRFVGQSLRGNIMEVVGRALTTSDLPSIMADVANKFLQQGFMSAEETFDLWTGVMPANDFKQTMLIGVSNIDGLLEIKEDGEYKYGYISDKHEHIQLGTYGRIYPLSRQAIINDDMNALTVIPAKRGEAARRLEGDVVYAVITANAAMNEDNTTLFHADHGNIGTAGLPDSDTMDEMDALFGAQTGIKGEALNIPIKYVLAPRGIRGATERFFNTVQILDANGQLLNNIWSGNSVQRIYEGRLQTADTKRWYCAGPKGTTIMRAHLSGIDTPYMEERTGWTVDGVEYKVRFDVAAAASDFRALATNPGR